METQIQYRPGRKEDSHRIAELDYIASGGAIEFLFHDLVPGMSPAEIIASGLEQDRYPHSYRSAIVAEHAEAIVGMALSFPGKFHTITDEMRDFIPHDRLEHFAHFFSAPVEDSYFLDALCVDKDFRKRGVGGRLIELTKAKARKEGYDSLSLLVYMDNSNAQRLYRNCGFAETERIQLAKHDLLPHTGGCVLMRADL